MRVQLFHFPTMSVEVITGGCQGADVIAMYWADIFHIPFHCILPSHHNMYFDLEENPQAPWHIGLSLNAGCWLFKRHEGINDLHYDILRSMLENQPLTSRFTVAPVEDNEAASACERLNSNFTQYSPASKAYLQRDYLIAKACDCVVAFGYLTRDASVDAHGEKSFVHGGTGWTVRLAQQLVRPVYLYDIIDRIWLNYAYDRQRFIRSPSAPALEGKCAAVGAREVTLATVAYDEIKELLYRTYRRLEQRTA